MINTHMNFEELYDYMMVLEESSRCTKTTKKTQSTRKGKKYMQCVKTKTGYKRVHYGQAGVRVGKNNPKRKKSFRARHKCSSAKPGTAKYLSCKNW